MNNTTLKQQIDTAITNKTAMRSITPANVGENIKATVDYIDQEIANIELTPGPQGNIGLQGPAGPQGVAGPAGPAGLNWQGQWVSGTSYVIDDAVGHNGASWFCINPTSGTTPPNADTTNWALLASQGAQGPQGLQGPAGTDLPQTFEQLSSVSNSAPFPYPTSSVALFNSMGVSYSLIPDPLIGDIRYIRTLFACTLYASPNPGNDGANNNFITPDGNGNSSISLSAGKVYRLTYLGRFGGIWGYWNIELINTLV